VLDADHPEPSRPGPVHVRHVVLGLHQDPLGSQPAVQPASMRR
jgi:hypothetical protein